MAALAPPRSSARAPSARAQGIACAVASAAFFAGNANLSRLAFASGSDAATLNAVRFAATVLVLLLLFVLGPARTPLTRRERLAAYGLGVLFFLTSFGYLGAIQFMPVSIAVLLLYSYPILVALIARVCGGEPLGRARIAALLLAFVGLSLALGIDAAGWPDWRGMALAALAAVAMALFVIGSGRLLRVADRAEVGRHLMTAAAALFLLVLLAGGAVRWPASGTGWLAFGGAVVTFILAQLALLAALGRAGPLLTAALMNLEPLFTVGLAVALAGESLAPRQLAGAALVLGAVVLAGRRRGTPPFAAAPAAPHIL